MRPIARISSTKFNRKNGFTLGVNKSHSHYIPLPLSPLPSHHFSLYISLPPFSLSLPSYYNQSYSLSTPSSLLSLPLPPTISLLSLSHTSTPPHYISPLSLTLYLPYLFVSLCLPLTHSNTPCPSPLSFFLFPSSHSHTFSLYPLLPISLPLPYHTIPYHTIKRKRKVRHTILYHTMVWKWHGNGMAWNGMAWKGMEW
jgi:hypothetical protein